MKLREIKFLAALVLPFLIAACIEKPVAPVLTMKTVTITGKVLRFDNQAPIAGALVTLRNIPTPISVKTDSTGFYRLSLETNSPLSAQIVTVASGFLEDTATVKIDPGKDITRHILLTEALATGLPDQAHFSITVDKRNFPGLVKLDATNTVTVRAGDKFGNPVARGTKINFSTHGGTIDGFAFTDASGLAQARLYGGNPSPVDPVNGRGFTWVKASAVGESGRGVQDSLLVLFSGEPQITGPASGFTLRDGGTQSFDYTVADENGNPLTGTTTINVSVTGSADVKLDGNINTLLTDTQSKGVGTTNFSFTLTDTKPLDEGRDQDLSLTISVVGPNGDKSYTFTGRLLAPSRSTGEATGFAAAIAFVQLERNAISVREVGGSETSVVTFEVRDSVGQPVDQAHQVDVSFELNGSAIDGALYVAPASVLSDPRTGRVRTTVNAGYKAGVVQVVARATVGSQVIRSAPVIINVFGGFPVQNLFRIWADRTNLPVSNGVPGSVKITVLAGDKYSNPVRPGTAIYFSTSCGVINVPPSAYTDQNGFASADLFPIAGISPGSCNVTATTVGENGNSILATIQFLFSGSTQISALASGFTLPDGGSRQFEYTVADDLGNPLSAGTSITVSVAGSNDVVLEGDINVVLSDTSRSTRFRFTLTDTKPLDKQGDKQLSITISVNSANGNKSYTFTGMLLGPDISGGTGTGEASAIAFVEASLNAISVTEVGGDETTLLTFEVRDSLGIPVDAQHQANVTFFIQSGPGGGEYLSPTSGTTQGSTGRVQTTLSSGIKAGVVQIVAQTTAGARTIRSAPIIVNIFGGFPDQAHFSIGSEKLNFPGYNILNLTNKITVIAGDRYSNPVKPGTAIYFRTTGGTINVPSTAYTDEDGVAVALLRSGNPRPYDPVLGVGFAYVAANTVGQSGNTVSDSTVVLFSGISQISDVSTTSFTVPAGGSSGPITFRVSDQNGNPLAGGTTINVTLQYTAPPNTTINLAVTGDIHVTLGDTQVKGPGTTEFSIQVVDQTAGGVPTPIPATVVISVSSPNGKPPDVKISGTIG